MPQTVHHLYYRMIFYACEKRIYLCYIFSTEIHIVFTEPGKMAYNAHQLYSFVKLCLNSFYCTVLANNREG